MKLAIAGIGDIGYIYASMVQNDECDGIEISALSEIKEEFKENLRTSVMNGAAVFDTDEALLEAMEKGLLEADAIIISSRNSLREKLAALAIKNGMNVLTEGPAGLSSRQVRIISEASAKAEKVFGISYNLRTYPVYKRLRQIVLSDEYGKLKRINWTVTDLYKTDAFYKASDSVNTWAEGGGMLLNQCCDCFDIVQWIFGMPERIQAFCREGLYHETKVDDEANVYMEWPDGAVGVITASTGELLGTNRLEIVYEDARIVCENNHINITESGLNMREEEYRKTSKEYSGEAVGEFTKLNLPEPENTKEEIFKAFIKACKGEGKVTADGEDGRRSMIILNAAYVSSWEKCMIRIPKLESIGEFEFEKDYERLLKRKAEE